MYSSNSKMTYVVVRRLDRIVTRKCASKGRGRQGTGAFCRQLLRFDAMPCRPMPALVQLRVVILLSRGFAHSLPMRPTHVASIRAVRIHVVRIPGGEIRGLPFVRKRKTTLKNKNRLRSNPPAFPDACHAIRAHMALLFWHHNSRIAAMYNTLGIISQ